MRDYETDPLDLGMGQSSEPTFDTTPMTQMPQYQSHKKVWALKIAEVRSRKLPQLDPEDPGRKGDRAGEAEFSLSFEGEGFEDVVVDKVWFDNRFMSSFIPPDAGSDELADYGYYVVYPDGFRSWSPSKTFEEGYTLIE